MKPTFSSPRNIGGQYINTHNAPFYNPQSKEGNGQHPATHPNKPIPPFMHQQHNNNSKSYQLKHNFDHAKPNSNNSAYLKSTVDSNSSHDNFQTYTPTHSKVGGEMTKSSFHDQPRMS